MAKQLRDLLESNSYKKKVDTDSSVTLGNKPKRKDIEDALTASGIELPTDDFEFEIDDKKGNVFVISYRLDGDNYYYIVKELVNT